jgi:hypothetical protein
MPKKPKTNQPQTPNVVQGRDFFQTPNYAVDLLVPFIPTGIKMVWEPACGDGKIVDALYASKNRPLVCYQSDIRQSSIMFNNIGNFLVDNPPMLFDTENWAIITNPPFSLKYKFINRALEYDVPFAFLIPFDMCQKMAKLFILGCQGLVPTSRIDYITPTGLSGASGHTSYYHSLWLTYKFNLPEQLTFVELTKKMKENI